MWETWIPGLGRYSVKGNGYPLQYSWASLVAQLVKKICLQCERSGFDPWVGKILWRRKWQPTPVFLPGESHGRRSLVGYSPRGRKESDTTERLHFTSLHLFTYFENSNSSINNRYTVPVCAKSLQSCTALCDPMDCSPPGFSVHGIFQARVLELGCHFLLQGIFPTQGSNPGLLQCKQTLYPLSHQGSTEDGPREYYA